MAVGVKGADMVRKRWDVGLGARALRRGRRGFAACPHHHVVEGRHVLQNRALRPQVCPLTIPGENSLFHEKRGGFRKKAVSDALHIYEG